MRWTKETHPTFGTIYIATAEIAFRDYWGRDRRIVETFRIDGRPGAAHMARNGNVEARSGRYRVDQNDMGLWVAIDGGAGFCSLRAAKAYVATYVAAAREQQTLSPRVERTHA